MSAHLFKVNLNKSEYIFELLDNSKMKINLKLILLWDTITVYRITMRKDADILKVTVATALYKHLTTQILPSRYNILKLYNLFQ
jgi:hypothetical protein